MAKKNGNITTEYRHSLFLNSYENAAFTKCPSCETKTKIRKFPLAILIQPDQLFLVNTDCKYCTACDLIIAKSSRIEYLMGLALGKTRLEIREDDYQVMGTLERKDWNASMQGKIDIDECCKRILYFKKIRSFQVIPAGWYRDGEHPLDRCNKPE